MGKRGVAMARFPAPGTWAAAPLMPGKPLDSLRPGGTRRRSDPKEEMVWT